MMMMMIMIVVTSAAAVGVSTMSRVGLSFALVADINAVSPGADYYPSSSDVSAGPVVRVGVTHCGQKENEPEKNEMNECIGR